MPLRLRQEVQAVPRPPRRTDRPDGARVVAVRFIGWRAPSRRARPRVA
nr:hypothetical protein [Nocardioides sp. URHA0032]